jgi:hypothetical protein
MDVYPGRWKVAGRTEGRHSDTPRAADMYTYFLSELGYYGRYFIIHARRQPLPVMAISLSIRVPDRLAMSSVDTLSRKLVFRL